MDQADLSPRITPMGTDKDASLDSSKAGIHWQQVKFSDGGITVEGNPREGANGAKSLDGTSRASRLRVTHDPRFASPGSSPGEDQS